MGLRSRGYQIETRKCLGGDRKRATGSDDKPYSSNRSAVPACFFGAIDKSGGCAGTPGVAEAVDDRIAAVAAEILRADLDARRRLAALVFGEIEQALDPAHRLRVVARGDRSGNSHLLLDEAVQDVVEHGIGRQRVLVLLVLAQFGGRRAWSRMFVGITSPSGPSAPSGFRGCASATGGTPPSCRGP